MRRGLSVVALGAVLAFPGAPAMAMPPGYSAAQQDFDGNLAIDERVKLQILLIAAGYTNAVPTEHFNTHVFDAARSFQSANGFPITGRLTQRQADRLLSEGGAKLGQWGFRTITHSSRPVTIWAPLGLGLSAKVNRSGLHYRDEQGRLEFDFVSVPGKSYVDVLRGLLLDKKHDGSTIHYAVNKAEEGWFVVSSTSPDGHDHYYRYHQDGSAVTGFALEWDNAAGNINAERIAVIMSGSLRAAMTGAPYVDPPRSDVAQAPVPQPVAAMPVASPPKPREGFSTGSGFFVSDTGHFVTNAHVVKGCSDIAVKMDDGKIRKAYELAVDETNDLALLKLAAAPARVAVIRLGSRLGEPVEAFGFPHADMLASTGNFTLGNITALAGLGDDSRFLQVSAPVQSGNSGGPLLDGSGNLVGVVSSKLNAIKVMVASNDLPQNVNFAIKSTILATFLDANRVTFKVGIAGGPVLAPADIADQARAMSGFVACH